MNEGDYLYTKVSVRDAQLLKTKLAELLSGEELELLREIEKLTKV